MGKRETKGLHGSRTAGATLTEGEVRIIRRHLDEGTATPKELAALHQTSVETIRRIGRREAWGWLSDIPQMPALPTRELNEFEKKDADEVLERLMRLQREQDGK